MLRMSSFRTLSATTYRRQLLQKWNRVESCALMFPLKVDVHHFIIFIEKELFLSCPQT